MVQFLTDKEEMAFRRYVNTELADKYDMYIEVREDRIVTGAIGEDKIEECLKIGFFINTSKVENIESKIAVDIHKYCFENNLKLKLQNLMNVERVAWNDKVKYNLIYISMEE